MLLAMSAWMRLMLGEAETAPVDGTSTSEGLPPERERIRRAVHGAVTAHPLHRELVHTHRLGGCQYYAFAGAMLLEALGHGRAEVALGRVAFRKHDVHSRARWFGYPAAPADVRPPDPKQPRQEAEAFPFHAWIRLTGPGGRRSVVDFDLTNVLREVRLREPLHAAALCHAPPAFWGSAAAARQAGLRFEPHRRLTADALLPGDRRVFAAIAADARERLKDV
ncbi:hypothetical protein [Roseomonas genomospecies 6]|uniref:Uncharacterized protein n=1 Tax=Roseomonas genomospecies 6 TaxID=214106 RepID=A0A9W7NJZ1_9PROT|nr:hypothetical protein [Roseomonas genomospecies 6]KAA0680979.1 hypothetical protein DS843_11265 [Roseomonas genomospecies 6]